MVREHRCRVLAMSCLLAGCDSSILLGSRPSETTPARDASPFDVASADTAPASDATSDVGGVEDCSGAIPDGLLAATPPMGWNGWNAFDCQPTLDEAKVL